MSTGQSPSWFLRSVLITDLDSEKEFGFVCDQWLAVESNDGLIDRRLTIAGEEDLKKFHLVFASTVSKGLVDGHIWFSIFLRPKESSFNRVRRLSACLALIFLTMLTNAMFFGAGDAPGAKKIVYLGNLRVNFTGVMIGIQSSIIVIPPSIIIVEIFRRLKSKKAPIYQIEEVEEKIETHEETYEHNAVSSSTQKLTKLPSEIKLNSKQLKPKEPFMFPNQCQYFAYFMVAACSGSSAIVTFFYSMMWGPKKSNEWLASMFTGFFQSVLVIQPIKAVAVAILLAMIVRAPVRQETVNDDEDDVIKTKDNDAKKKKKVKTSDGISANDISLIM